MSSEKDSFGRKPERSLKDRMLSTKLGRRATAGLVTLGLLGGGTAVGEGIQWVAKSDGPTKTEQVKKLNIIVQGPQKVENGDINVNPDLPKELQMGDQRVGSGLGDESSEVITAYADLSGMLESESELNDTTADQDINVNPDLPKELQMGDQRVTIDGEAQEDFGKMETPVPPQPNTEELKKFQSKISKISPQLYYPTDQFGLGESARHYNNPKK